VFVGTFEHSLDEKGRLVLPATFRGDLAPGGFVGQLDRCLGVWTPDGFEDLVSRLNERVKAREVNPMSLRALTANAADVKPDGQGRIFIPQRLRDFAGIGREAVVIGAYERIEVWDRARWAEASGEADRSWVEVVTGGI
jgi:MraZ protein